MSGYRSFCWMNTLLVPLTLVCAIGNWGDFHAVLGWFSASCGWGVAAMVSWTVEIVRNER
jgi:hypothetical protein